MIDWKTLYKTISGAERILLSTHENPDGDGLGSAAAMYLFLKNSGKDCRIIHVSELPFEYNFLNNDGIFETYEPEKHDSWISDVDLSLIFDVGDFKRLRAIGDLLHRYNIHIVNIDHHPDLGDERFTQNVIDVFAAATGEMVYEFFKTNNISMTQKMLEGIYTAVMTDTGSFRHNNTNEKCHEIAIACIKEGLNTSKIYQQVYETSSKGRMRLLGKILDTLSFEYDSELAWFTIDEALLKKTETDKKDVDGFTDFIRTIRGVEIALMIFQNSSDTCRINYRSKGKYVINEMAKALGGGGHKYAAGAVVDGSLKEVIPKVLNLTTSSMAKQNGRIK